MGGLDRWEQQQRYKERIFFIDFFFFAGETLGEVVLRGRVWFGLSQTRKPSFILSLPGVRGGAALPGQVPPLAAPCHKPTAQTGVTSGLMEGGKFYVWGFFN